MAVLGASSPGVPAGANGSAPAAASPGVPVKVQSALKPAGVRAANQASRPFKATATRWPGAASGSVLLAGPANGQAAGPVSKIPRTPLWVQSVGVSQLAGADAVAAAQVSATVLPHARAAGLGVSALVFQLTGPAPAGGRVRVGLDYASFGQAFGGNFGTRLRLVRLPACALTTPRRAVCRVQTPLGSVLDYKTSTVSAVVGLGVTAAGSVMSYSPASAETAASAGLVLAVTSTAGQEGGPGGAYPATPLSPAGTWTEGRASGAFTYSYPIALPGASTKLVPSASLSYDSQATDGKTATAQAQSSWLGDGWQTPDSSISMQTTSCADSPEGSASPSATTDECYDGKIAQMSLNGSNTPLVFASSSTSNGVTTSVWRPQDDSGEVVTHVSASSAVFGKYSLGDDYWTVTERNGTKYEFGLQHLRGWASGDAQTNSVDTMPVYSAHSGDPCYDSSGFTASVCPMAYQWHLDYVVDGHSAAMAYFYTQATNYYGEDQGASNVPYTSDSYLDHIAYGFIDGQAYGTPPDIIAFNAKTRCLAATCGALSTSNANVSTQYPDVPADLICAKGATCTSYAPALFSQVRLGSVTTEQYSASAGAYQDVDTYQFSQLEPASGDGLAATLWLNSITRTADDISAGGSSSPVALPKVSFGKIDLQNRVLTATYPGLYRYRIASITSETGAVTGVTYGTPDACSSSYSSSSGTSVTSANTDSCFPVYWTPTANNGSPVLDWFESYAVTQVLTADPSGGSLTEESDYSYGGGAAWHYDDNEVVQPKYRTWGQFRGYATVTIRTGQTANNPQTEATTAYYRGMNGDTLPSGTASVTLTDSQGGSHADSNLLAGNPFEATTYLGSGGPVVASTITSYWVSPATATVSRSGLPDLTANMTGPAETWTRTALTDGGETGQWNVAETDNTYDATPSDADFGLLTYSYRHTDPVNAAYDSCTRDQYAAANTAENLVGLISYTETDHVACSGYTAGSPASVPSGLNTLGAPASVSATQVSSATETFYDDPSSFSTAFPQAAAPTTGNVTMTRRASSYSGSAFTWQTESRGTYDAYGRVLDAYDADGNETVTSYTVNSAGLTTGVQVAAPPTTYVNSSGTTITTAHVSSRTLNPPRGLVLTSTDQNGVVTTEQYDALGRLTSVWKSGRTTATAANITYAYTVTNAAGAVSGVVTGTLNAEGNYVPSATIYDSLGRVRQTQALGTTPSGDGRLVTDTLYDSRGWASQVITNYYDSSSLPALDLFAVPANQAHDLHEYVYDGTGRQVEDTSVDASTAISSTVTVYNGNSTTVIPGIPGTPASGAIPAKAGTVQTTKVNPVGQTSALTEYTANPTLAIPSNTATGTFSISGGTASTTSYAYDAMGNQDSETLGGASWTQQYNLLGHETQSADPSGGTTAMNYDANGNLLQSLDASGKYASWLYDQDGRKTAQYAAASTDQAAYASTTSPGNQTASWVYDNANGVLAGTVYADGRATTATSYAGGYAYKSQQLGFNAFGESTGEVVYLPAGAPGAGLGTAMGFQNTYEPVNGGLVKASFPSGGGLPAETVTHGTTGALDLPSGVGGLNGYAEGTSYTAQGQPEQVTIGAGTSEAFVTDTYDPRTGSLTGQAVTRSTATPTAVDATSYGYSPAGALVSETDERLGSAAASEAQCFAYTTRGQLSQAWTATDKCAATPAAASHATVGDGLGTASEYDESWTFGALGEPVTKTAWVPVSGALATTAYGYSVAAPAELTSAATTGAATASSAFAYYANGEQQTRSTPAGNQTLAWNNTGGLSGVTATSGGAAVASYVYGADGSLFSQTEGAKTTVFLPGEQLSIDTSTATPTLSGVRFYALPGGVTAVRTGAGAAYGFEVASDQHGTGTLWLDSTAQVPAWRQFGPYGAPRGAAAAAGFPGSRAFLGDLADAGTGLTDVGARWYDPATGMFASLDPVLETGSPLQLNGYGYAAGNPATNSDPTGLSCDASHENANCWINGGPCVINPASCTNNNPGGTGDQGGTSTGGGGSSGSAACARFGVGCTATPSPAGGSDARVAVDNALGWLNAGANWLDQVTGINDAVACAEAPSAGGCEQAAGSVAMGILAVGTDGLGEAADAALATLEADRAATLQAAVATRASEVVSSQSIRVRGPVLSGAMDTQTGDIYFGQNAASIPDPLHPDLQQRLGDFPGPGAAYKGIPGTHSEIYAANQGLFARPGSQISDFIFYSVRLRGAANGDPIEMCQNCSQILGG